MILAGQARAARKRYREMSPVLNEQSRRRFVALEARALGRGGVSLMARISGLARSTIYHGLSDIRDQASAPSGRVRKPGGGRKKKSIQDPTLVVDLKRLVEPVTRGDPMQPLLWTTRSLRNLANELANKGHEVCPTVVGDLLHGMGYSLQANSKTREGGLKVRAELDENKYPKGVKVSDLQMAAVNLTRHTFHGDWNYTVSPKRNNPRQKRID
jgi:hypothetical protein